MLRQRNHSGERKNEEPRKNNTSYNTGRSATERNSNVQDERSRVDNTRVVRMDPRRLNDLYERSSI